MLPLYFDHHARTAVAKGLRRRGVDVLTAEEDGHGAADDAAILRRATALGRVVFTSDQDFLQLGRRWQSEGVEFAGIVYGHQLRINVGETIQDLQLISALMSPAEMIGTIVYLPL